MGEMRRAVNREEQEGGTQDRFVSTTVIAAAIIAAVRLAHDEIANLLPRPDSPVADSVAFARMIPKRVIEG